MFGQVGTDSVIISYPAKDATAADQSAAQLTNHNEEGGGATSIVESVGLLLFAMYHVTVIIVLINMLIAMMSHSFEDIQVILIYCRPKPADISVSQYHSLQADSNVVFVYTAWLMMVDGAI